MSRNNCACFLLALGIAVLVPQSLGQDAKAEHAAAQKMRELIDKAKKAKTEEEHWLVTYQVIQLLKKPIAAMPEPSATAAAKELLKELFSAAEQILNGSADREAWAVYNLYMVVIQVLGEHFTGALLPLLESAENEILRKSALGHVIEFMPTRFLGPFSSRPAGLEK